MLAAAWQAVSQCCTRRELRDSLKQGQHLRRAEREQIDEIAGLLNLLQPRTGATDGPKDARYLDHLPAAGHFGSSAGDVNVSRDARPAATASKLQGTAQTSEEVSMSASLGSAPFTIGAQNWAEIQEQFPREGPAHNGTSRDSGVTGTYAESAELRADPGSEPIHGHSSYKGEVSVPRLSFTNSCAKQTNGRASQTNRDFTAIELASPSSRHRESACSSDETITFDALENNRGSAQERQQPHLDSADDPDSPNWGLHRHFSRVREAVSSGLTKAATQALPAVHNLWRARETKDKDGGAENRGGREENLFSWAPDSSLDFLRSSSWLFGTKGSQNRHTPLHKRQVFSRDFQPDSSSSPSITKQRTNDNATNGGDMLVSFPVVPSLQSDAHATPPPCVDSGSLPAISAVHDGGLEYFCVLGASTGCEGSSSFKRRPIVARPLRTSLQETANFLGTVSLTGDSLGRKAHWCKVLKAAADTGAAAAQHASRRSLQQEHLEHVLLLQLLQQQQRMVLLPSALNNTQQIGVCRAHDLWIGAVVQGVGFEAPAAAEYVAVQLLKELLHRCATSKVPLWVKRLDSAMAEHYMLDSFQGSEPPLSLQSSLEQPRRANSSSWPGFLNQPLESAGSYALSGSALVHAQLAACISVYCTAVAVELQVQQTRLGGGGSSFSTRLRPDQESQSNISTSTRALEGFSRLRKHRQVLLRKHPLLSGRTRNVQGEGLSKPHRWGRPCGFDSLTSGAVACQFLWDAEQQLLLVCHTGDVRAVLAHPARERQKQDQADVEHVAGRDLSHFTAAAAAAGKRFQRQQWSWNDRQVDASWYPLSLTYDCVVLTREHSTLDRDERRRVQGAGVFMAGFPAGGQGSCDEKTRRPSSGSCISQQHYMENLVQDASTEAFEDEGPSFFCPCLLTPPLTATRSLGLCGGHQFGISTAPDVASVTLERTIGLCFLLVATSSLWKIFSPQEAVDIVVAELWRQQRQHNEQQRQRHRLSKTRQSSRSRVAHQGDVSQRAHHRLNDSSPRNAATSGGTEPGTSFEQFSQNDKKLQSRTPTEGGELPEDEAGQITLSSNLQLAADVLERCFCEEWQLQREREPLADLGFVLLALESPAYRGTRGDSTNRSSQNSSRGTEANYSGRKAARLLKGRSGPPLGSTTQRRL